MNSTFSIFAYIVEVTFSKASNTDQLPWTFNEIVIIHIQLKNRIYVKYLSFNLWHQATTLSQIDKHLSNFFPTNQLMVKGPAIPGWQCQDLNSSDQQLSILTTELPLPTHCLHRYFNLLLYDLGHTLKIACNEFRIADKNADS